MAQDSLNGSVVNNDFNGQNRINIRTSYLYKEIYFNDFQCCRVRKVALQIKCVCIGLD